ncbi:MAG: hypothetical protein QMD65_02430 [Patescibacteria group bacterium]|nr:hypothetical protein [Patescibacteria group bacterium]
MLQSSFKRGGSIFLKGEGFTLIELMIYVSVFVVIGALGATVLDFTLRTKKVNTRLNEVYLNTEKAISQIIERVQVSTVIKDTTTSDILDLEMASSTINPTKFTLQNSAVVIKEGNNATTTITPSTIIVSLLSFTRISNASSTINSSSTSVQITIRAAYNDNGAADEATSYTLQTTAMPL